jgi:ABC-type transporter Mla MlaB component
MDDKIRHQVVGEKFIIEMITNRFTHDLVSLINTTYPYSHLSTFKVVEFNLEQVKMIDSTSIGFLFELHNKFKADLGHARLIISVGSNSELKDLLHRFQVDMLLDVQ